MAAAERSDVPELSAGDAASGTSAEIAAPAPDADVLVLPTAETHDLVLCCRRCRQPLLRPANLTDHDRGRQAFSYRRQAKEREQHGGADDAGAAAAACTSYFLDEPLQWMKVGPAAPPALRGFTRHAASVRVPHAGLSALEGA